MKKNKKEKKKDVFETQCWAYKIIEDPYQVFAELFDSSGIHHLRSLIGKVMKYVISPCTYKGECAADMLLYMRQIHSVIKAAHALKEKSSNIKVYEDNLLNAKYFQCNRMFTDYWTDFPRFLSKKEYCNPYLVFKKFFKYQSLENWLATWRDIIDGALCPEESRSSINEITVHNYLIKLIEAVHLIDVRETTHINGHLKNRNIDD